MSIGSGLALYMPDELIMLNGRICTCRSGPGLSGVERVKSPTCAAAEVSNPRRETM